MTSSSWNPSVGEETTQLLTRVPEESRAEVRSSAVSILSRCLPPNGTRGQQTGLVIGYVQSGKTMSFQTVTALARDNGYQIVILLAGTANPLLDQSIGRLRRDFQLDSPDRPRRWLQFTNPGNDDSKIKAINDVLADWSEQNTPEDYKKTIVITVLKNHIRLRNLTELMRALNLSEVPVLIIDDEADQASLNNDVAQGDESTTYTRIMELRQSCPHHTYLQYTATPQAPLLINIIDSLSPNFVQVLEPGPEYVGGREFFENNQNLVRVIPATDIPTNTNILTEPPESLLEALRVFMVGVAAGLCQGRNRGNRSMLVHPSHLTDLHQEYCRWVRDVFAEWRRIFLLPDNDRDKQDLIQDFHSAYNDLTGTVDNLPAFNSLVPYFRLAFTNTQIQEMNRRTGPTPKVDWTSFYGWILVGGRVMDRGFTVESLTVTYMPRGIGVGNADTVQQRARFFGYKRQYLGYCRIFLEQGTMQAYQAYVEHEEDIRVQLQQFQRSGRHLNEWKRAFLLETALRPCRHSVLEFDYIRGNFASRWASPRVILASNDVIQSNRSAVNAFLRAHTFVDDSGDARRRPVQKHRVCRSIPLRTVLEFLASLRVVEAFDSKRNTGLLLQLAHALEDNPQEECIVYEMSPVERRTREVNDEGEIKQLFQGGYPVQPAAQQGTIYPGDREIKDSNIITVQIHTLDLTRNGQNVEAAVPVVAVWIPDRLARAWIAQQV